MCWSTISPTTQKPSLVRRCRANIGPTTSVCLLGVYRSVCYRCSNPLHYRRGGPTNFSVGPIVGQCQHAYNDLLTTSQTITQRWPNDLFDSHLNQSKITKEKRRELELTITHELSKNPSSFADTVKSIANINIFEKLYREKSKINLMF